MSADGDIVRDKVNYWVPEVHRGPVLTALARLEAAAADLALDVARWRTSQQQTQKAYEAAEAQRDALAEALRWYADPLNWPLAIDGRYDRARAALAEAGLE